MPTHQWRLSRAPKYARNGVVRVVPPAETIRRVAPMMGAIGVTRVADVTGLDRVGIPNYVSVRPRERDDGISYYNGKGYTKLAAKAGAMMEAIERYSGERCDLPVFFESWADMQRRGPTLDPGTLVMPWTRQLDPADRIEWVWGFDLLSGQPTFVPLNVVVCPYLPAPNVPIPFYTSTNGLASGNTVEEALCHAMCEVIERDTKAIFDAWRDLGPAVGRILSGGLDVRTSGPAFPLVDLDTLPPRPSALARRLQRAQLGVYLRDVTWTAGIPAFDCAIAELLIDGTLVAHGGTGCHPDARVAVARALTEAAQSRLAHIQGGREDLDRIVQPRVMRDPDEVFGGGPTVSFSTLPSFEHPNVDHDVRFMLKRLARDHFSQVIVVNLTRPEIGVPVVRVLIPQAETWSVYFAHARHGRFGPRVSRILEEFR